MCVRERERVSLVGCVINRYFFQQVLQALRRLKGNKERKAKMAFETKIVFDQLTEDAMKLMENGEYS